MSDKFTLPPVISTVKSGKFTLKIYAYRKLQKAELLQAVQIYLQQKHLKTLPSSGTDKLITTFGNNPLDSL